MWFTGLRAWSKMLHVLRHEVYIKSKKKFKCCAFPAIVRPGRACPWRSPTEPVDEVESLCLVNECRELEERYKVDYTSKILVSEPEDRHVIIKEIEKAIHKDQVKKIWHSSCSLPQSTNIFAKSLIWWDGRNYGITLLTTAQPVSLP